MPRKGTVNNPHGRKKGTPNKVTSDMKERIKQFIDGEFDNVMADFKGLDAKDKILLFERFLAYVLPKQRETTSDVTIRQSPLSEMTRKEITAEIERIQKIRDDK